MPGFMQGQTKKEMEDLIRDKLSSMGVADLKSISSDGSSFDSTQSWQAMSVVDAPLLEIMNDKIMELLKHNDSFKSTDFPRFEGEYRRYCSGLIDTLFIPLPDNDCMTDWPADVIANWNHDWANEHGKYSDEVRQSFIFVKIKGQTLSGKTLRTTLGNTFRNLLMSFYYVE